MASMTRGSERARLLGRTAGAIKAGCAVAAAAILILLLAGGGCVASKRNGLVASEEKVRAAWSGIENQYRRRADLVPQLVETVKGAAEFEKTVLTDVIEARASVGRVQLPEIPTDPAQLDAYIRAQQGLSGALGRLFAVSEQYPTLRTSENFSSLQDQIEGTENRITTAHTDYIDVVRAYNTEVRRFPGNLIASVFGFEPAAQITVDPAARERPEIDFGFGEGK